MFGGNLSNGKRQTGPIFGISTVATCAERKDPRIQSPRLQPTYPKSTHAHIHRSSGASAAHGSGAQASNKESKTPLAPIFDRRRTKDQAALPWRQQRFEILWHGAPRFLIYRISMPGILPLHPSPHSCARLFLIVIKRVAKRTSRSQG